jgi:hypothetical protein
LRGRLARVLDREVDRDLLAGERLRIVEGPGHVECHLGRAGCPGVRRERDADDPREQD